jgi:hypothetical protein
VHVGKLRILLRPPNFFRPPTRSLSETRTHPLYPSVFVDEKDKKMATQLAPLSACVTRILSVSGFPKELRTKDINQAFSDWDNVQGGFKVKWIDDTSLYVVFNDPTVGESIVFDGWTKLMGRL